MNLILVDPDEVCGGRIALDGRRAEHIAQQLRAQVGDSIRVGRMHHGSGEAEVLALTADPASVVLRYDVDHETAAPPNPADVLLLAVPRPAVLQRVLAAATTIGFGKILLIRTWRVDKSHLQSDALSEPAVHRAVRDGLEQSARTAPPVIERHFLFKPFVQDALPNLLEGVSARFVAHPRAAMPSHAIEVPEPTAPFAVAIGPERGFTDYELDQFATTGFVPVRGGPHPLRVETAVVAMHARLDELRNRGR